MESGYGMSQKQPGEYPYAHKHMGTTSILEDVAGTNSLKQRHQQYKMNTGTMHYKHETLDVGGRDSQGSSQASSQMTIVKSTSFGDAQSVSQTSWEEGTILSGKEPQFRQTRYDIHCMFVFALLTHLSTASMCLKIKMY